MRHGQVITGEGDVDGVLEQVGLGPGTRRTGSASATSARLGGDLGSGARLRVLIPAVGEQPRGGVDDPLVILAGPAPGDAAAL